MRSQSWLLASALGLAAIAKAEELEHPRIYFPRVVKREFFNSTTRGPDLFPQPLPDTTAAPDSSASKRDDVVSELISDLLGGSSGKTQGSGDHAASATGIVIGPTGIVESKTSKVRSTDDLGLLGPIISDLLPGSDTSSDSSSTTESGDNSGSAQRTTADSSTTASSDGGLLPFLSSILDLPGPTESAHRSQDPSTSTSGGLIPILTSLFGNPGTTSAATADHTTSTEGGIIPILTSLFPGPTQSTHTADDSTTTTSGLLPILTSILPKPTTTTDFPISIPTSGPVDKPPTTVATSLPVTNEPPPTSILTTGLPHTTGSDLVPVINSTRSSVPTTNPISLPTSLPTNSLLSITNTSLPDLSSAATGSLPPTSVDNSSGATATTALVTPAATAGSGSQPITAVPSTTASAQPSSSDFIPTTFLGEATSFSFNPATDTATGTNTFVIPTNVPQVILPADAQPDAPPPSDSKLIQIGFLFPLNYEFVADNFKAASQIFRYLPDALAHAGGIGTDKIQINKLVPDNTMSRYGYITTLAKIYYPQTLVQSLQLDLMSPNSALYNHPESIVRNLTSVINPMIDLLGDISEGPNQNGGSGAGNLGSAGSDAFGDDTSGSSQTSKKKAATAGIAIGAVAVAGMYGAAMFIVARRYKRKRQSSHARTSSLDTGSVASSEMRYTGTGSPALMGGALLSRDFSGYGGIPGQRHSDGSGSTDPQSSRTANISAPLNAENSLGWN